MIRIKQNYYNNKKNGLDINEALYAECFFSDAITKMTMYEKTNKLIVYMEPDAETIYNLPKYIVEACKENNTELPEIIIRFNKEE